MTFPIFPYKITIKIKSFDVLQLQKICIYIKKISLFSGVKKTSLFFLPNKKKHISVCRSPHIHKKSRTQFVYKRTKAVMSFRVSNLQTLHIFLFFFKTSFLPGVEYELSISEKAYIL